MKEKVRPNIYHKTRKAKKRLFFRVTLLFSRQGPRYKRFLEEIKDGNQVMSEEIR